MEFDSGSGDISDVVASRPAFAVVTTSTAPGGSSGVTTTLIVIGALFLLGVGVLLVAEYVRPSLPNC